MKPEIINAESAETFNTPLKVSDPQPTQEAASPEKMKYEARDKGRQRKFYEIIALLEMHYAGDHRLWNKLDGQMQRYFKREYPEYFDRDSKGKRDKRQANKVEATRVRHERFQRSIKRSASTVSGERTTPIELSIRRDKVSGG